MPYHATMMPLMVLCLLMENFYHGTATSTSASTSQHPVPLPGHFLLFYPANALHPSAVSCVFGGGKAISLIKLHGAAP